MTSSTKTRTIELLTGSNWREWKFRILNLLREEDLDNLILDGEELENYPQDAEEDDDNAKSEILKSQIEWRKRNKKALAIICNSVDNSFISSLEKCVTPKKHTTL
jgi:hypothetical protein